MRQARYRHIRAGIDLDKVVLTGDFISQAIGRPPASRAGRALLLKLREQA